MSAPAASPDPLFASLDALVRDGTLAPQQADLVYWRVRPQLSEARTEPADVLTRTEPADVPAAFQPVGHLPRIVTAAGIVATGIVFAGFLVISNLPSDRGFEWKTFLPLVVLTVCLGAAGLLNLRLARTGPGAVLTGVLATTAVVALALTSESSWDATALVYLAGVLLIAGGVGGMWLLHQELCVVAAVVGGLVLMIQAFSDLAGDGDAGSGTVLMFGVVVLVYGIAVAAAGWQFACRHLTGVLGGLLAVGAMTFVVYFLGVLAVVTVSFGSSSSSGALSGGSIRSSADHTTRDIWIALVLGLGACIALAALFALTGYARYVVVAFAGAVLLPALTITLTAPEHPLRSALATSAVAGAAVAAAVLWSRLARRHPDVRSRRHPDVRSQ